MNGSFASYNDNVNVDEDDDETDTRNESFYRSQSPAAAPCNDNIFRRRQQQRPPVVSSDSPAVHLAPRLECFSITPSQQQDRQDQQPEELSAQAIINCGGSTNVSSRTSSPVTQVSVSTITNAFSNNVPATTTTTNVRCKSPRLKHEEKQYKQQKRREGERRVNEPNLGNGKKYVGVVMVGQQRYNPPEMGGTGSSNGGVVNRQCTTTTRRDRTFPVDERLRQSRHPLSTTSFRTDNSSSRSTISTENNYTAGSHSPFDPYSSSLYNPEGSGRFSSGMMITDNSSIPRAETASEFVSRFREHARFHGASELVVETYRHVDPPTMEEKEDENSVTSPLTTDFESPRSVMDQRLGARPAWFRGGVEVDLGLSRSDPGAVENSKKSNKENERQQHEQRKDCANSAHRRRQHLTHDSPRSARYCPQQVAVVLKNNVKEEHSAHMLGYASPVLAENMRQDGKGRWILEIPNGTEDEWQMIKPFLQPHSIQKAVVTSQNLTILLPWFRQLQLKILLDESDAILSSLTFSPTDPSQQDWYDCVLLARICNLANLPTTWQSSLDTLQTYLAHHPAVISQDKRGLRNIMQLLWECPSALQFLWPTLKMYVPQELLNDYKTDRDAAVNLVGNLLFPYLFRERVEKHVLVLRQEREREKEREQLEVWQQRKKALEMAGQELQQMQQYNAVLGKETTTATSSWTEPSWMQPDPSDSVHPSGSPPNDDDMPKPIIVDDNDNNDSIIYGHDKLMSSQAASEKTWMDFVSWWNSWSLNQAIACTSENESWCKEKFQQQEQGENQNHHQQQRRKRDDSPEVLPQRTAWLEGILRNLQRPSLFRETDGQKNKKNNATNQPDKLTPSDKERPLSLPTMSSSDSSEHAPSQRPPSHVITTPTTTSRTFSC